MTVPNRNYSSPSYRYGFNGKGKDDDVKGSGMQLDYGFRIYDPRLGKFLSTDPLFKDYPFYTPYQFAGNSPIAAIDVDGLEPYFTTLEGAERVAQDINAIYYNTYGGEEAMCALSVSRKELTTTTYSFLNKLGIGEPTTTTKVVFVLTPSENFNWSKDRYTKAFKGILDSDVPVSFGLTQDTRLEGVPDTREVWDDFDDEYYTSPTNNDDKWKIIANTGGGTVKNYPNVKISDKLLVTEIGDKVSKISWTLGSVVLHEAIYHLTELGKMESKKPNKMRKHYELKESESPLGRDHGEGTLTETQGVSEEYIKENDNER